ncbi:MAG: type II toxin-antitoxin system VapC family toxin [Alphaproteobacteria bacterium]
MMVLDTNVLSELLRPTPERSVASWVDRHARSELFTTSINQAEIVYGLELLPAGRRRSRIEQAIADIFAIDFAGRILPFDSAAAIEFGALAAERRRGGRPIGIADAQIAAIARVWNAPVITRDVADFTGVGATVINPWSD